MMVRLVISQALTVLKSRENKPQKSQVEHQVLILNP